MFNKAAPAEAPPLRWELDGSRSAFDLWGLLTPPFDDVLRAAGASREALTSPVELGPCASAALARLYAEFGIPSRPATVGELLGSLWYCRFLHIHAYRPSLWVGLESRKFAFDSTVAALKRYAPEFLEPVIAYMAGDKQALRQFNEVQMPLSRMARHYCPDAGWSLSAAGA